MAVKPTYENLERRVKDLEKQVRRYAETERILRESEDRYRGLFERAVDGIVLINPQGRFLDCNPSYARMLGYSLKELKSMTFYDVTPEDLHEWEKSEIMAEKIMKEGYSEIFEKRYIRKDGTVFPVEIAGFKLEGKDGKPPVIMAIVRDITHRKLAEAHREHSGIDYRDLADKMVDCIAIFQKGKMVYVNDALVAMMGYSKDHLLATSPRKVVQADHLDRYDELTALADRNMPAERFEIPLITASGDEIWVEGRNSIIEWIGKPGIFVTMRDVTEAKLRETAFEESTERLQQENVQIKSLLKERFRFGDIIGKSGAMQEVYEAILRASVSNANVVIYGESGTGKELVARAIHGTSDRSGNAFVPVNCGAIPEPLLESEFFGHKKGSFTGADYDKHGYLDIADGGTLFLDELGELGLNMQVKLLRALDVHEYTPLGSGRSKKTDVRIIAATNRDLKAMVKNGTMREDFFYRVHIVPITLPPLRERREDIPLLVDHYLSVLNDKGERATIPGDVMGSLLNYDWPGNVRELQNVLQRYLAVKRLDFMQTEEQSDVIRSACARVGNEGGLREILHEVEREIILRELERYRWSRTRVSTSLGLPRRTLFRKMKIHGLA